MEGSESACACTEAEGRELDESVYAMRRRMNPGTLDITENGSSQGEYSMITSLSNAQVKNVLHLNQKSRARREQGIFSAEGRKMFLEAPSSWIEKVYISESMEREPAVEAALEGISWELVADKVFRQMSDTQTPQGILTLLKMPSYSLEEVLGKKADPLLILLEDLQDPGNVGTILRTAEGAGADGILMTAGTADLFNPKVIRSTMGSIYRMPFYRMEDPGDVLRILKERGIRSYAAHLDGENAYDREDYRSGSVFLIGNEGNGLSEQMTRQADCLIRIPMAGCVESLNAAMAAGILMYEAFRQRRN